MGSPATNVYLHRAEDDPIRDRTMAELDVKRFLTRLNKLQSHFLKHKYVEK
jgi:hypothetical protein